MSSLREKYTKIKGQIRSSVSTSAKNFKKTGSGPCQEKPEQLSEPIQELASLLTLSTYGHDPLLDCDANSDEDQIPMQVEYLLQEDDTLQYLDIEPSSNTNESVTDGHIDLRVEDVNQAKEVSKKSNEHDSKENAAKPWHYSPATLRQPVHPSLYTKRKHSKLEPSRAKFMKMQEDWARELHELKVRQMTEKHAQEMEVLALARERAQYDVTTSRLRLREERQSIGKNHSDTELEFEL